MAEIAPAEGPILSAILDASYDIWCEGLSRVAYERYYAAQLRTEWGRAHLTRWALVDGTDVLASAKLYDFHAILDGDRIRVLGLGAVFTQPAHRRRGAARELIERLLHRGEEDGVDLALLFSEIGADYYARLGFARIPRTQATLAVTTSDRRGAPAILVRSGDDRDLRDIVAMNAAGAGSVRFQLDRDRDLIQYAIAKKRLVAGLSAPGRHAVQFLVAEEGASAVAYVVITVDPRGAWMLEECGDRDPSGARVGAILQTLIARDPAEARPTIAAWLPPRFLPPQVRIVGSQPPPSDVMMVRPFSARAKAALPLDGDAVLYWHSDAF